MWAFSHANFVDIIGRRLTHVFLASAPLSTLAARFGYVIPRRFSGVLCHSTARKRLGDNRKSVIKYAILIEDKPWTSGVLVRIPCENFRFQNRKNAAPLIEKHFFFFFQLTRGTAVNIIRIDPGGKSSSWFSDFSHNFFRVFGRSFTHVFLASYPSSPVLALFLFRFWSPIIWGAAGTL